MPGETDPQGFVSNEKAVKTAQKDAEAAGPSSIPGLTAGEAATDAKAPAGLYGGSKGAQSSEANVIAAGTQQTGAQMIQSLLAPYVKELTQLGPEYQQEMNFLAPYLSPAHQQSFQDIVNTSKADESSTGDTAVSAADTAQGEAMLNAQKPGFAGEAQAGKEAAAAAPYQGNIQTALAYQKYIQTYGGQAADTSNWPAAPAAAYGAIMGGTTQSGLPSVANAAAANQANTNLTLTQGQGNPSGTG